MPTLSAPSRRSLAFAVATAVLGFSGAAHAEDDQPMVEVAEAPAVADQSEGPGATAPFGPTTAAEPSTAGSKTSWYGWQTLITDGAAASLFAISATTTNERTFSLVHLGAAAGAFALGAPIIHLAHARPVVAGVSAGLRLAVPTALVFAGIALTKRKTCDGGESGCNGFAALRNGAIAGGVGVLALSALDALVFARSPEPSPNNLARRPGQPRFVTNVSVGPEVDVAGVPGGISISGQLF